MATPAKTNTEALFIPDDTKKIETNRVNEKVLLEEQSSIGVDDTYGSSMIWGSSSNGIWGTDTWGEDGRVETTPFVVNPNNIFRERFRDNYFENTGSTTADWGDVSGQMDFTNTEVAVSNSIALNDGTITKATITVTVSSGDVADLTFELTANGGSNWESVTHNTQHTFTNTGTDLRFRITASGSVSITFVKVEYN